MPKICVPIQETNQKAVLKRLKSLKGKADLAEIWLDHIQDLDISTLLKTAPLPVVCVCKKPVEKGRFKGDYSDVAAVLIQAGIKGAAYIDIPLEMPKNLNKKIVQKTPDCQHIVSFHDFKETPPSDALFKKALSMRKSGADIVKIATAANKEKDAIRLIMLAKRLQNADIPHIIIGMGQQGVITRILTPHLGGTMMFAPLQQSGASAPGQLTAKELKNAWNLIQTS